MKPMLGCALLTRHENFTPASVYMAFMAKPVLIVSRIPRPSATKAYQMSTIVLYAER